MAGAVMVAFAVAMAMVAVAFVAMVVEAIAVIVASVFAVGVDVAVVVAVVFAVAVVVDVAVVVVVSFFRMACMRCNHDCLACANTCSKEQKHWQKTHGLQQCALKSKS